MKPLEGWYPDPKEPIPERYWNGEYWTRRIRTTLDTNMVVITETEDEPKIPGRAWSSPGSMYSFMNPQSETITTSIASAFGLYMGLILVSVIFDTNNVWNNSQENSFVPFFFFGYFVNAVSVAIGMYDYPRDTSKSIFYKIKVVPFMQQFLRPFISY